MVFLSSVSPVEGNIHDISAIIAASRIGSYSLSLKSQFISELLQWLARNRGKQDHLPCTEKEWTEFGSVLAQITNPAECRFSREFLGTIVAIEDVAGRRFDDLPPQLHYITLKGPGNIVTVIAKEHMLSRESDVLNVLLEKDFKEKRERSIDLSHLSPQVFTLLCGFLETGEVDEDVLRLAPIDEAFDVAVQFALPELIRAGWNLAKSGLLEAIESAEKKEALVSSEELVRLIASFAVKDSQVFKCLGEDPSQTLRALINPKSDNGRFIEVDWRHYFGLQGKFHVPRNLVSVLYGRCPFWKDKTVMETHIPLLILPDTTPLTLNRMWQLVQDSRGCKGVRLSHFDQAIRDEFGDTAVSESYWVLVTKCYIEDLDGVENSQEDLLEKVRSTANIDYRFPSLLEAFTLEVFTQASGYKNLRRPERGYYRTLCQEKLQDGRSTFVGGHGSKSVDISCLQNPDFGRIYRKFGVLAVRPL